MTFKRAALAVVFAALVIESGCAADAPARHIVVFIDRSCSVKDALIDGYRADWNGVVAALQPGDWLTMGPITSDTYETFRPVIDERLPRFRPISDNRLRFDARTRQVRERMLTAFDGVTQMTCSQRTPLLDTLNLAQKLFGNTNEAGVLVLMSDMIEDSAELRFDRMKITPELAQRIIAARRRDGILPDLRNTDVYISGATTSISAREVQRLQQFWIVYFAATGARLSANHYGPTLLSSGSEPDSSGTTPGPRRQPNTPKDGSQLAAEVSERRP